MNIKFQALVFLVFFQGAYCSGKLQLKLKSFYNPNHKLNDGSCCDNGIGSCSSACDNYFKICLTKPSASRCDIGRTETGVVGEDSITFGKSLGGAISNPIVYGFRKWEGSFTLSIEVWDKDGGIFTREDDLTARYDENIVIGPGHNKKASSYKTVSLRNTHSTLNIDVRVYCDSGYLVPSCNEYCAYTNDDRGHYECDFMNGTKICLDGWYGDRCLNKKRHCVPQDDDANGHYECDLVTGKIICLSGWKNESSKCLQEIDECLSNPCLNGGKCKDLTNEFNCSCKQGYAGKTCETDINECASNPCKFGTCHQPMINAYKCHCYEGYEGNNCETESDECLSNPCRNGTCINALNNYKCICNNGYTGASCNYEINECISIPCQNNATCVDLIGAYKCQCSAEFTGRRCEFGIKNGIHTNAVQASSAELLLKNSILPSSILPSSILPSSILPSSILPNSILPSSILPSIVIQRSKVITDKTLNKHSMSLNGEWRTYEVRIVATSIKETKIMSKGVPQSSKIYILATASYDTLKSRRPESSIVAQMTSQDTFASVTPINSQKTIKASSLQRSFTKGSSVCESTTPLTDKALYETKVAMSKSESMRSTAESNSKHDILRRSSETTARLRTSVSGDQNPMLVKELQFRIEMKGDYNKWEEKNEKIFKEMICNFVKKFCKNDGGCKRPDSRYPSLEIRNDKEDVNSFFGDLTFFLNKTSGFEAEEAKKCFEESIIKSSSSIETKLPIKVGSIKILDKKSVLISATTTQQVYTPSSSARIGDSIGIETRALGGDTSKMVALIVIGHFFVITALIIGVQWIKKRGLTRRIQQAPAIFHGKAFVNDRYYELKTTNEGDNMIRSYSNQDSSSSNSNNSNSSNTRNEGNRKQTKLKKPRSFEKDAEKLAVDAHLETLFL